MDEAALTFVARLRDEASSAARTLRGNLRGLSGKVGGVLVPIKARDEATSILNRVSSTADKAGRGLLRGATVVAAGAARTGGIIAGALGVAGGAAIALGLKTAAGMQTAQIGFSTMLGSAQKADAFLRQLSAFAASTPFEFPELQTAASSLISAGIDASKVIPIMRTLGDVTSGMGTGSEGVQRATIALQQMSAAGKITGEDLNQLRDAGIPVFDLLAAATGKSKAEVVKLAQAGKLGGKELGQLMNALETGKGLERFSGLMDKQSRSLTGVVSTLHDTVAMGLAKALQPAIPMLTDLALKANDLATRALPGMTAKVQGLITAIPQLVGHVRVVKAAFEDAGAGSDLFARTLSAATGIPVDGIRQVQQIMGELGTVIRDVVVPAFTTAGSSALPAFLTPLGLLRLALGWAAQNTDTARVALTAIIAVLTVARAATAAHTVVTTAQGVAASVLAAKERAATIATNIGTAATRASTVARAASQSTIATWIGVKALELGAWVRSTAAATADRVAMLASNAARGVGALMTWIAAKSLEAATWLRQTAATVASTTATLVASGAAKAAAAAQWLLNAAMSANPIGLVIGLLIALGVGLVILWKKSETFRSIVLGVWGAVRAGIGAAVAWIRGAVSAMGGTIRLVWSVIVAVVGAYVRTYVAIIRAAFTAARAVVSAVMAAVGAVVRGGVAAVKAYIAGIAAIVGVVRSAFERAKGAASSAISGLLGIVRAIPGNILGVFSNVGGTMATVGGQIVDGIAQGIRDAASRVLSAVRDLAMKIPAPMRKLLGIKSPSRLFRTQIGQQLGAGTALGIRDSIPDAVRQAAALAGAVTQAADVGRLAQLAHTQGMAGLSTVQRVTLAPVTVRHEVSFTDPTVAARLSARDVADMLNRDPRALRAVESGLSGVRGQLATTQITAPSSRR